MHAAVTHLEHADLVGRTEPVFLAPEDAEGVVPLAFEVEHRINDVLEHPRTGDGAFLIASPDAKPRNLPVLAKRPSSTSALAHPVEPARVRGYPAQKHALPRTYHRLMRRRGLELPD